MPEKALGVTIGSLMSIYIILLPDILMYYTHINYKGKPAPVENILGHLQHLFIKSTSHGMF